jgi:TolB protein
VLRGGAWNSDADKCRSGYRFKEFPVYSDACFGADSYGFRRARNATPVSAAQRLALPAEPKEEELVKSPSGEAKPPSHTAAPPAAPPSSSGKVDASRLRGTIVFVSDRGASLDVWSMRADGASQTPLTKDEFPDADPRFSPNGEQILYTSLRGGFPEVWLMARDGKEARKITEGSQGQWSPDGKAIVFIRDDQVFLRELASGKERRVTPADWQRCGVPSFRPDGKQIAIASRHLGDIGVFLVELDKPGASQVKTQDPCCTPCWSPDAKRLLFQTVKGHIHELDLASGREEQLTFDADVQHDGRYSPDGTMVVFSRAPGPEGPWQICVLDLQSDNLDIQQITREGSNNLPDWHGAQSP